MNDVIVEEVGKVWKTFDQILVDRVHRGAEDSHSMCFDRIEQLIDWDCLDLLGLFSDLNKDISMQVVVEVCDILLYVSKQV